MKIDWPRKPKNVASVIVLALAIVFALGLYAFRGVFFSRSVSFSRDATVTAYRHPLTGLPSATPVERPQVYSVMIDHSSDAWPQSGVDQAFLVIEAPVEAGIPRLLAFFTNDQHVQKIGPVRSARPYFVDWANELDALYVHVGGSDAALDQISSDGTFDLNQFWNGNAFWRARDRQSPHNVYTSTDLLAAALARLRAAGKTPFLVYGSWKFEDPPSILPEQGVNVLIDLFPTIYRAHWQYQPKTNRYRRVQGGLPFAMENDAVIEAENVAIVITRIEVTDTIGHRKITTIGEGDAYVFKDGEAIEGRWKKPSQSERLRFYDKNGNEISFHPGKTWIEVVDSKDRVIIQR